MAVIETTAHYAKRVDVTIAQLCLRTDQSVIEETDLAEYNHLTIAQLADRMTEWVMQHGVQTQLVRGDCLWIADFTYRNDGRFFWDGHHVIPQDTEEDDYGMVPKQLLIPTLRF